MREKEKQRQLKNKILPLNFASCVFFVYITPFAKFWHYVFKRAPKRAPGWCLDSFIVYLEYFTNDNKVLNLTFQRGNDNLNVWAETKLSANKYLFMHSVTCLFNQQYWSYYIQAHVLDSWYIVIKNKIKKVDLDLLGATNYEMNIQIEKKRIIWKKNYSEKRKQGSNRIKKKYLRGCMYGIRFVLKGFSRDKWR